MIDRLTGPHKSLLYQLPTFSHPTIIDRCTPDLLHPLPTSAATSRATTKPTMDRSEFPPRINAETCARGNPKERCGALGLSGNGEVEGRGVCGWGRCDGGGLEWIVGDECLEVCREGRGSMDGMDDGDDGFLMGESLPLLVPECFADLSTRHTSRFIQSSNPVEHPP